MSGQAGGQPGAGAGGMADAAGGWGCGETAGFEEYVAVTMQMPHNIHAPSLRLSRHVDDTKSDRLFSVTDQVTSAGK